jgi:acyl-CoA synthetase (AMP-forming)/AMP-acid ligase II
MRVLLMVRPGIEFVGLMYALFKMGAVPVLIDPGMGVGRLLECVQDVRPQALVGIPLAHAVRLVRPRPFNSVTCSVAVGRHSFWGGSTLADLERSAQDRFVAIETRPDEPAAILFTSGSTGPAKGVVYEHGMFEAQVRLIQEHYDVREGEVDLPGFPPFALFSVAMGLTVVFPDTNLTRPAQVNPAEIVRAIHQHQVTNTFGSPAMWRAVTRYALARGLTLPTIRRVLIAGAPVSWPLIEQVRRLLPPGADVHTPYGATEALPVASIGGAERGKVKKSKSQKVEIVSELTAASPSSRPMLCVGAGDTGGGSAAVSQGPTHALPFPGDDSTVGRGICVGWPFREVEVRLIRITDDPIEDWSEDLLVEQGNPGEITVAGPVVTREYFGMPAATRCAKIREGDRIWHRMGDVAYRDDDGRLWFCGRKAHRVETANGMLFSVCCESVFNRHPAVFRSALVGIGPKGQQVPAIVIELTDGFQRRWLRRSTILQELLELGQSDPMTRGIHHVLYRRRFPVDVRHQTKISWEALAVWAARRLRRCIPGR